MTDIVHIYLDGDRLAMCGHERRTDVTAGDDWPVCRDCADLLLAELDALSASQRRPA